MTSTTKTFSDPHQEIAYLKDQITQITTTYEAKITQITATFETKIRLMEHRMDQMLKRLYGKSSEKLDSSQLLMQELILEADKHNAPKAEDVLPIAETKIAGHTRRHFGRQALPEHLKRVEHTMDIKIEDKSCECGKELVHIGDDVTERLDYQPSSLFVNRYVRPKYACGDSMCEGCGVKQHPTPDGPIDRCEADSGLLAHVIEEKYEHHNPLYRQETRFERQGVNISRQTMSDWMMGCADALRPLYELMKEKILEYDIVLNDDTPVDMRDGPSPGMQTARMWATVGGEEFKYTLYNFTINRCKEGPLEFFHGYSQYFMSDGYAGYDKLFKPPKEEAGVTGKAKHLACWAHARRYFVESVNSSPSAANGVLVLIAGLYRIESHIKRMTTEEKFNIRLKESAPILAKMKVKLEEILPLHLPQSPMRQAIHYALVRWDDLNVYLEDGRLPIDNNLAENAIRPIALGRKNWLFLGSEIGGHTAAVLMSFTATCRKNKINTWAYLKDVLQRIQSHPISRLDELLPDQWQQLQTIKTQSPKKIPTL